MEMNEYTHTLLAVGLMMGAYLLGRYLESRAIIENAIGSCLESLENGGYIRTTTDKDGDKELIPISEIVAETVRDALSEPK
jgi:hypothetical protein